jgi:hypothetical protein
MHFTALFTASLAAGALASVSVSNPHNRVKKAAKRAPLQRERLPLAKRQSSSFLTSQTKSKYSFVCFSREESHPVQSSRSMAPAFLK